jgi:diguanylate cyclase (GGDEF)-like protein/PAS domain S-box-containing protein
MDVPPDLLLHEAALAATTNGIVISDADASGDYPIRYVNAGFERVTGYSAEDILGRNCRILQGPGTDPAAIAELRAALAGERPTTVTLLNYRSDGRPFWNEISLSPVRDGGRMTHVIGVQTDVTERRLAEEQVRFLAYHDTLTGLANRARLQERLTEQLARAQSAGSELALLFLDLDGFKQVNDRYGHAAGDELLRQATERLSGVVRPGDLLARQGGDEFLLVLGEVASGAAARGADVAERLAAALSGGFLLAGETVHVTASIGISTYPGDARDARTLLQHADGAMYAAKAAGGGTYRMHGERPANPTVTPAPAAAPDAAADAADAAELDRILAEGLIVPRFQPIVDLDDDAVVAYEALARGPEDSPLHRPDRLFAVAVRTGRLEELDRLCREAAVRAGLAGGVHAPLRLFVNVEPSALTSVDPVAGGDAIVVELTERALVDRPAGVISAVAALREQGVGIALDDIGADRRSLAFMPFVAPDVIKLDLRLVQGNPTAEIAAIVHAVNAEAERSGAIVLAEGIETEEHRGIARALGATHGQGWLFGRPDALPDPVSVPARPLPTRAAWSPPPEGETPFGLVCAERPTRRGSKRLLLSISKHLEAQAMAHGDAAVVLSTFQEARHLTDASRGRYQRLAQSAAFVGVFGVGLPDEPVAGVRGASLDTTEPLRGEWNVVVVTPHFAAAFVGRDLGDEGPDMERRFDFCLTYDRALAVRAAAALMRRILPR